MMGDRSQQTLGKMKALCCSARLQDGGDLAGIGRCLDRKVRKKPLERECRVGGRRRPPLSPEPGNEARPMQGWEPNHLLQTHFPHP